MEKLLISACLLGVNCKYNGKNNLNPLIEELKKKYILIPICPEVMGGLPIPRDPSEIIGDRVISSNGKDVTKEYNLGAKMSLDTALKMNIDKAILKDGSPSCGKTYIYDGTFSKKKISGMGITTKNLIKNNIKIYNEKEIEDLI